MKNKPCLSSASPASRFDRKLLGYSVAAGAALALVPAAKAQIKNLTLFSYDVGSTFTATPPDTTVNLNLEVATANQSLVFNFGLLRANPGYVAVANHGPLGVAVVSGTNVVLFPLGAPIVTSFRAFGQNGQQVFADGGSHFQFKSHTGYFGFKAYANAHTYYGWLRAKVTGNTQIALVAKNGYPNIFGAVGLQADNIMAGQINTIPEPANVATGLALLALGAAGVREHRRRRAAYSAPASP